MLSDIRDSWASGLFEGEGCISWGNTNGKYASVELAMNMTDRDVMESFLDWAGCGRLYDVRRQPGLKRQYAWRTGNKDDVRAVLIRMIPHLHSRRLEKAMFALDYIADYQALRYANGVVRAEEAV